MSHLDSGSDRFPLIVKLGIALAIAAIVWVVVRVIAPNF
jgi:uncharacterized membrane protein